MNNNFKDSGSFGVSDDYVDFGGTTPINSKPNNKLFNSHFNQSQDSNNISSQTRNSKINNRDNGDEKSKNFDSNSGIQPVD